MSDQLDLANAVRTISDPAQAKDVLTVDHIMTLLYELADSQQARHAWQAHQKLIEAAGELVTGPRWQTGANNAMSKLTREWYTLYPPQESEKVS